MQIQINTGHNIEGSVALSTHVESTVKKVLHHMEAHLTRVEVHLEENNGDMGCKLEARPRHHQPIVVSHKADTVHQALDGAAVKMKSSLEHLFGRLEAKRRHTENVENESSL